MNDIEYNAAPGIRRSSLWKIAQSPAHFKYWEEHPSPSTPALRFGQALHCYLLEDPREFDRVYAVAPDVDRRYKTGKETYQQFMAEANAAGKTIITNDEYYQIFDMAQAVREHPVARDLIIDSAQELHEKPFFWTDRKTSELCKVKVDAIATYNGKPVIVDYKTTESCADGAFERSVRKYGYKLQVGMYTEALFEATMDEYGFVFVAQEKTPPYAVRVYECDADFIAEGVDEFRALLGMYHHCKETGNWFGYEGEENTATMLHGEG